MSIILQSTIGGFSDRFRRQLLFVEKTMTERGLEPSSFIISKDNAVTSNARSVGPFFYDYTVFVDGKNFTVTEPNDDRFLAYFSARILAASGPAPRRRLGPIGRFVRWMSRPI